MPNVSREVAKANGERRYRTGLACKRGHLSERLVINHRCVECQRIDDSLWRKSHRSRCTAQSRKWRDSNRERVRANKLAYYRASEQERANQAVRSKKWLEANREKSRAASAKWRKAHLATAAAAQQRRKAKLLKSMPPWADQEQIRQFYERAKRLTEETGVKHEVDHIVPLQGKLVSGLHIHTNLQILTMQANRSKGARFAVG